MAPEVELVGREEAEIMAVKIMIGVVSVVAPALVSAVVIEVVVDAPGRARISARSATANCMRFDISYFPKEVSSAWLCRWRAVVAQRTDERILSFRFAACGALKQICASFRDAGVKPRRGGGHDAGVTPLGSSR